MLFSALRATRPLLRPTAPLLKPTAPLLRSSKPLLSVEECDRLLTYPGSPFETHRLQIDGRDIRCWKNTPHSFPAFINATMPKWGEKQLLSTPIAAPEPFEARELVTFAEGYEKALELAVILAEHGVEAGTRVAIGGTNSTGWVVSFLAVFLAGGVPVLLNNGLHVDAQLHCLQLTKPKLVLVDDKLAAQLAGKVETWCWSPTSHLSNKEGVTEMSSLKADPARVAKIRNDPPPVGPESDGIIFFTSGTTSLPKGVLVTHRQAMHIIHSAPYQTARHRLRQGVDPQTAAESAIKPRDGVALLSIPLFHVQGCLSWLVLALHNGSKLVFLRHWSVPAAVKLMTEENVTKIGGVPAIATAILQSPLVPEDYELETVAYGGSTPPSELAHNLVKRWPKLVPATGWGMTETSGFHTGFLGQEYLDKPHGAGQALPVTELKVVGPDGQELGPGEAGTLLCRGQTLMKEYVGNPKATAESIREGGWFDTGDIAFIDVFGDLHIVDRAKELIIRGGENVPSAEVERALLSDPRVAEACAVPVPCELMSERVGVCVTLAPGAKATPREIAEAAWPKLRYCARPDIVVIVDNMPWTTSQKVVRGEVKKTVAEEWERIGRKPLVDSRDAKARM